MSASSPTPIPLSRKLSQALMRRLAQKSLAEIAGVIGKDESQASRLRSGEARLTVQEFAELAAALGFKLVDQDRVCVDRKTYEAMAHINARAMSNPIVAKQLMWDEDGEPE